MPSIPPDPPDTKHLPRLLCLHGGGVNATVFQLQSRSLVRHLQHSFRLVWADGPFLCAPHPDIITVYGSYAPFRRWLRWLPEQAHMDGETCIDEMGHAIQRAMQDDSGTGEWVGLLGFSQGAKVAASILLEQQARQHHGPNTNHDIHVGFIALPVFWRFAVLLAGSAPLVNLNPRIMQSRALLGPADLPREFDFENLPDEHVVLSSPTLHVHGTADPGIELHRRLWSDCCASGTATLVEWDGPHRVPVMSKDVEPVVGAVYDLAERTGVSVKRTV